MTSEKGGFHKMAAPKGMHFMKGSSGNMDYLMLGVFDGFKIGFKPLYQRSKTYHAMGFRIRIEWDETETSILDLKAAVKMRFPTVPFSKCNLNYCSMVGAVVMKEVDDHASAEMWMDNVNYIESTMQTVRSLFDIDFGDDTETIKKFLNDAYHLLVDVVNSDTKVPKDVHSGGGNIIPLKPKDKGNE